MARFRFRPVLAGADLRERVLACVGAVLGIGGAAAIASLPMFAGMSPPLLIAPLGASAVLLFCVPTSPMAQPWSIVGGHVVSALVGAAAVFIPEPSLAAGAAVSGAIAFMSLSRCLHPPGGGTALMMVLAGTPSGLGEVLGLALAPVALNALCLLAIGWAFHRWVSGRAYPRRAAAAAPVEAADGLRGVTVEDVDLALEDLGESFDVSREDLKVLLARAEGHAETRRAAERAAA